MEALILQALGLQIGVPTAMHCIKLRMAVRKVTVTWHSICCQHVDSGATVWETPSQWGQRRFTRQRTTRPCARLCWKSTIVMAFKKQLGEQRNLPQFSPKALCTKRPEITWKGHLLSVSTYYQEILRTLTCISQERCWPKPVWSLVTMIGLGPYRTWFVAWLGKTTEALVTKLKVRLSLLLSKQSILRNGTAQPGFGPQQWKEASISTSPKFHCCHSVNHSCHVRSWFAEI